MSQQTPSPGSSRSGASGCRAGPPQPTWRRRRQGTPCAPGAGSATPVGRCACMPRPPRCATTRRGRARHRGGPAGPARGGGLHRRCGRRLRFRASAPRWSTPTSAACWPARCRPASTLPRRSPARSSALAESLVPADPAHRRHLERRRDGARGAGLHRARTALRGLPRRGAVRLAAGRPTGIRGAAAPRSGVARHRPASPRRPARGAARAHHRPSRGQSSRQRSPTPASGSAASTPLSRTGWWSRSLAGASGSRGRRRRPVCLVWGAARPARSQEGLERTARDAPCATAPPGPARRWDGALRQACGWRAAAAGLA